MARKSNLNTSLSDVKFHSVSIIPKTGAPVSIAGLWNVINLHESIFRPVITGNIQVNDTVNLRSSYKFEGEEQLYISFSKPTVSAIGESKYAKTFRIIKIEGYKQNENGSGATYTLHFCSEELFTSTNKKISRTFENGKMSDYVKSICLSDLSINPKEINIFEESYGPVRTLNIRDKGPLEAIEVFERFAINEAKSPFLFFENFFGYNFMSLSRMLDGTSIVPGGLIVSTAKNSEDAAKYVPVKFNEILNFQFEKINDTLEASRNITLSGSLDTIDILRGNFSTYDYDVRDMDKGNLANKESIFPQNRSVESNKNFWLTNKDRSNMPWRLTSSASSRINALTNISPYAMETNVRENDSNIENFLLQRQSMLNLLEYASITGCEVAGNPAFTVGVPVDIKMPAFTKNDGIKRNVDPYLSGRYVITKVRHNLTKSTGMRTFIAVSTNSPSNPLF